MNLMRRGPLGLKPEKEGKNPEHLDLVAALPCVVCEAFGEVQDTPTQVHHPICERYSDRKLPDMECIPLCRGHHLTGEGGKLAVHSGKETWQAKYGSDRDYIAVTLDKLGK